MINLIGKKLINLKHGKGTVIAQEDWKVSVRFENGETIKYNVEQSMVEVVGLSADESSELEATRAAYAEKKSCVGEEIARRVECDRERRSELSEKRNARPNVSFKCNYCDGGLDANGIGYCNVCSPAMVKENIRLGRAWCNQDTCLCKQYNDGKLAYSGLQEAFNRGEFICYESRMLIDWKAYAGEDMNGEVVGKGRRIVNIGRNSLCVLTTCFPDHQENPRERFIFAAFVIDTAYIGDDSMAGFVVADAKLKLQLTKEESKKMPFWNYHVNENAPKNHSWGSGLYRYSDDVEAREVLRNLVKVTKGTKEEAVAEELLTEFCAKVGMTK